MLISDRNWGIIIFSSGWQLDLLSEIQYCFLMEHSKVPRSILSIVQKIPVVYALLKNKTTGIYRGMLQILQEKLRQRNKELAATAIVCDYKLGFRNAIETEFPQIPIWGCYFQFIKALLKHTAVCKFRFWRFSDMVFQQTEKCIHQENFVLGVVFWLKLSLPLSFWPLPKAWISPLPLSRDTYMGFFDCLSVEPDSSSQLKKERFAVFY